MLVVVSYDISDNKRRERLRKALLTFGNPIQFSVFECDLTRRQIETMQRVIRGIITAGKDNVRIYQICAMCAENVEIFGGKALAKTENVYVV